jgi:Common central domain of tyrosinase
MAERCLRRDVRTLAGGAAGAGWDQRMLAYAHAVEVMQARGPEDPTSWIAQATLHRERPQGTWFFLPWRRMQLWFLERIMRTIVVAAGGPRDWALPFWSHAPGDAALPPVFRSPTLPDGAPNPLHRPAGERAPGMNEGTPLPAALTSPARALAARTFAPELGGAPAGPASVREPRAPGLLELQPHDAVAAALGPRPALDPVFPLLLAEVDRLWEVWLARGGGRSNPVHFDWADHTFAFCDADGRGRDLTCGQVGDLVNLDYAYSGVRLPARTQPVLRPGADAAAVPPCPGRGRAIATGAEGVELGTQPRRVVLRPPAGGPAPAADARRARAYLCIEDAVAVAVPGSVWEVRVEHGDGAAGGGDGAPVGTIAFPCPAATRRFVLDITDAVEGLGGGALAVSFHPALPRGFAAGDGPAARIGRVVVTDG